MFSDNPESALLSAVNSPWFSLFMLVIIIGNIIFSISMNTSFAKNENQISDSFAPVNRILVYYIGEYFSSYTAGKDIRMYNQKNFLMNEFMSFLNDPTVFKRVFYLQVKYGTLGHLASGIINFDELRGCDELLDTFDEDLWYSIVERVVIYDKSNVVMQFKSGIITYHKVHIQY